MENIHMYMYGDVHIHINGNDNNENTLSNESTTQTNLNNTTQTNLNNTTRQYTNSTQTNLNNTNTPQNTENNGNENSENDGNENSENNGNENRINVSMINRRIQQRRQSFSPFYYTYLYNNDLSGNTLFSNINPIINNNSDNANSENTTDNRQPSIESETQHVANVLRGIIDDSDLLTIPTPIWRTTQSNRTSVNDLSSNSSVSIINEEMIGNEDHICPICRNMYSSNEIVRTINRCGHCFHLNCADRWYSTHTTCPMCREQLSY